MFCKEWAQIFEGRYTLGHTLEARYYAGIKTFCFILSPNTTDRSFSFKDGDGERLAQFLLNPDRRKSGDRRNHA